MHTSPFGSSADGSFAAISQARSNRGRRESDYWGRMVRGSGNVAARSAVEQAVLLTFSPAGVWAARSSPAGELKEDGWARSILFPAIARYPLVSLQAAGNQRAENRVATYWAGQATAGLLHAYFSTGKRIEGREDRGQTRGWHPSRGWGSSTAPMLVLTCHAPRLADFPPAGPSHM